MTGERARPRPPDSTCGSGVRDVATHAGDWYVGPPPSPALTSILLLALVFAGCQDETSSMPMRDDGSPAALAHIAEDSPTVRPLRVASGTLAATRFLVRLGARRSLTAVDRESHRIAGLDTLPFFDPEGFEPTDFDIVFVAARRERAIGEAGMGAGSDLVTSDRARIVEFDPHDLEDLFALGRTLGSELVGPAAANRFEHEISRPLALVAGRSSPIGRPRVAGIVGVNPFEIVGGHSFETDIIEIAGGTSVTHGGDDSRRIVTLEELAAMTPEILLVMHPRIGGEDVERAIAASPIQPRIVFFPFDRDAFWWNDAAAQAERLRERIQEVAGKPAGRASPGVDRASR